MWRTGSGDDTDSEGARNGFSDIIDGSTAWLGFAFNFPTGQNSQINSGILKIWMGDGIKNGRVNSGGPKYNRPDPGEPNRRFTGDTPADSEWQQGRLGLEISSVGTTGVQNVNNVVIYRSNAGAGPETQPAWSRTGSLEILPDVWYWGVWEVLPLNTPNGRSVFYIGTSTTPIVSLTGDNCRDTDASTIISNLAFAVRGEKSRRW